MQRHHLLAGGAACALAFFASSALAQSASSPRTSSASAAPVGGRGGVQSGTSDAAAAQGSSSANPQTSSESAAPVRSAPAQDVPYIPRSSSEITMETMQAKIDALQADLDAMKKALGQQTVAVAAIQKAPKATLANGRPGWASADGNFTAALNGVMQFDAANYYQSGGLPPQITGAARDLNGGTNARRARLGFGGKAFGDFEYNFLYEFGGSGAEDAAHIQELWLQYNGFLKPLHLRVGYFDPLAGMEANTSTNGLAFNERAAPAEVARGLAGGDFRSALQLFGNDDFKTTTGPKIGWLFGAAVTGNTAGNINSAGSFQTQPFDEQLGFTGRAAVNVRFAEDEIIHVGVNGQRVEHPNDNTGAGSAVAGRYTIQLRDRPELRVDGTRLVDTGALNAKHASDYGAELGGQFKTFYAQAEYFRFKIDGDAATATTSSPDFSGYYVQGSWILTGEHRAYSLGNGAFNAPVVAHPFSWSGRTWGAVELAGRYSDLDLNYRQGVAGAATPAGGVRGGEQEIYSASLIWYPNAIVRFLLMGQHVDIDRLNAAGLRLDQGYETISLRSQLAF